VLCYTRIEEPREMVTIVLGSQWGDEGKWPQRRRLEVANPWDFPPSLLLGKGKITDLLSQNATLCCRSAGGHSKSSRALRHNTPR
jgi:adenylosuccinate synthase